MNDDNPNTLKWIKNVKSNWNKIQKMVKEAENYQSQWKSFSSNME